MYVATAPMVFIYFTTTLAVRTQRYTEELYRHRRAAAFHLC